MTGIHKDNEKKIERNWRSFQRARSEAADSDRRRRRGFRILVLLAALLAVSGSVFYASRVNPFLRVSGPVLSGAAEPRPEPAFHPPVNGTPPSFASIAEGKFYEDRDGYRLLYTVDPSLQNRVQEVFQKHRPPYAVFVALEPQSGKIFALAEYARARSEAGGIWQRATYPAASVPRN